MPSVSVIIPCYNHGRYLCDALDSVLAQTYADWEAIVVDDGSTDDTAEVAQRYSEKNARIRYVHQENGGESAARNRGLDLAQGTYIAFLDADDLYLSNALADHVAFLKAMPRHAVSYSDGFFCDAQGHKLLRLSETREAAYEGRILEHLVLTPNSLITNCTMTRTSAIRDTNVRFDSALKIGPDWDFWIQLAAQVEFGYLDSDTCMYRIHAGSITQTSGRQRRQLDLLFGRRKVMEAPWFADLPDGTQRAFFFALLCDVAMGLPDQQKNIIDSPAFYRLEPTTRSQLLRQLATQCVLHREDSELILAYLEAALGLDPKDRVARTLQRAVTTSPVVAYAMVWGRKQVGAVSRNVRGIGKRHPRPVPRELRPIGD